MRYFFVSLALSVSLLAQTPVGSRTGFGTQDNHGAVHTAPHRTGTGSPVGRDVCVVVGETYLQTDSTPANATWSCTVVGAPGTWVQSAGAAALTGDVVTSGSNATVQRVGGKSASQVASTVEKVAAASPTGAPYAVAVYDGNGILQSTAPQPFSDSTSATVHNFPNPFLTANVAVQDLTDSSGNVLLGCLKSATSLTITITCGIATGVKGNFIGSSNGGVQVQGNGSSFYQTVQANGTARTQRSALNFSSAFSVTDNNGSDRTEIDINQIAGAKVNGNIAGKAATADALAATPTLCPAGQAPTGILPNGNATGCAVLGSSGSTGPVDVPDLNFFKITRVSATQFTIGPGVCGIGNNPARFATTMTVTLTGSGDGDVAVYCDTTTQTASLKAQLRKASANTLGISCANGCVAETGTATPPDGIEFGKMAIQSGAFPSTGAITDERGLGIVGPPTRAGSGLEEEMVNGQRLIKPPTAAITATVVVKGSDGNNCNLVFTNGFLTGKTCP